MDDPRVNTQMLERSTLSPLAMASERSKGRELPEPECRIRTCYQRDIDRIIHSKAFRRLKHKTQVFLQPEGDHYRTRLTHTLEVARIARTMARALRLNEDLTEAAALGHDLGHTPFGHAGERALNEILQNEGGFQHNEQSLRVVDCLENDGHGLNLTFEVRNGIKCHTGPEKPAALECGLVRFADRIAYLNHDLDDALRAGILTAVPEEIKCALGAGHSERINTLILDVVKWASEYGELAMSPEIAFAYDLFYSFMFQNVYSNTIAKREETKVFGILNGIFGYYVKNPDKLPEEFSAIAQTDGLNRAVADYVSGMTDKYAMYIYGELFIPEVWKIL